MRLAPLLMAVLLVGCAGKDSAEDAGGTPLPGTASFSPLPSTTAPTASVSPSPTPVPPQRPPAEEGPLVFAPPVTLASVGVAEPGVATGPDGALYAVVWTSLFRSLDGGASWERMETSFEHNGDADLVAAADGTFHYLGLDANRDADLRLPYWRSADGVAWEGPVGLEGAEDESAERPWLVEAGGTLIVAASDYVGQSDRAFRSDDGGTTWSGPIGLPGPYATNVGPAAAHGETVAIARRASNVVHVSLSTDAGRTWTDVEVPGSGGAGAGFPTVAFDAAGTLYVASTSDDALPNVAGATLPRARVWSTPDLGATWEGPSVVSPATSSAVYPWVAAGGAGRVAVAFYEDTVSSPSGLAGTWYATVATSSDGGATWATAHTTADPVRVGGICTFGATCSQSGGDWSFRDYFELGFTAEGRPFAAHPRDPTPGSGRLGLGVEVVAVVAESGWTSG